MKPKLLSALGWAILSGAALIPAARAQSPDPIIDATDNLFWLMLGGNQADASLILTALRSTRDPALLPVFTRVAQRTEPVMQLGANVAMVIATKDPAKLDLPKALVCPDALMLRAAFSLLIDENLMTNEQLTTVMQTTADSATRAMVVCELAHRKALADHQKLVDLAKDPLPFVRFYAGFALLESADAADNKLGLETINDATWPPKDADRYNPRDIPTQGLIVLRVRKDKVTAAVPWLVALTQDDKIDEAIRMASIESLLELQRSEGPQALAKLVANPPKVQSRKIRVALMALQYSSQLKPGLVTPLAANDTGILQQTAALANQAAEGADITSGLVKLINQGQPFIMDWALMSAETAEPARQMLLWKTLIENSAIVDESRARDFERAAMAAEKVATANTPAGRAMLKTFLKSDNRAIVEAVLAGIYRSTATDKSELIADFWTRFQEHQSAPYENAANYAALTLAREGKAAAKSWLGGMVQGGTVQDIGFRALAGWYYAQLTGQGDALAKRFAASK